MAEDRKSPNAGQLDQRVKLLFSWHEINDPITSEVTYGWDSERDVWANIVPVGTAVYFDNLQTENQITHRVIIRWRDDIDVNTRIIRSRYLNGAITTEHFRVLRASDLNGDRWFTIIEVSQEARGNGQ